MSEALLSQTDGDVHFLTINRPERRNALTPKIARALAEEIDHVEAAGRARVIVLRGAGGHFSAGLDLHWLAGLGGVPELPALQRGLDDFQSAILAIIRSPVPVVAVLQGTVAGFGFDLAVACDLRIAGRSASLTSAFARMGLVPDGGSTFTLPSLVGLGRALKLLLTGETLDADAALAIGLVEEVADDADIDRVVATLVEGMRTSAPSSLLALKRLTRSAQIGAVEQALAAEGALQIQALQSDAFRQRLLAFASRGGAPTTRERSSLSREHS